MIDIKRRVPRFDINFTISSNNIKGKGINISQTGLGFLTDQELIPAEDIPFKTEIKGYIFSDKTYPVKGKARLLYSILTKTHRELFYNGFEFIKLDNKSKEKLYELLNDIREYQKSQDSKFEEKTLADFVYYPSNDLFGKANLFYEAINKKDASLFEMLSYYLDSPSSSYSSFIHRKTKKTRNMIMMGSNNYLGLTTHPDVIKAGIDALKKYGTGNGAGAMVGGTLSIHKKLEEDLADFTGKESAMIFNSGYSTNLGVISGLLRPQDAIINDQSNHASIFDGCSLSGAKILLFSHNDISSLKKVLKRANLEYNGLMIVVDGIYSTNGSIAPLSGITKLAKKYNCKVMVDEAHAFGILGKKGIGASEHFELVDKTDIIMGTMSKSLAGAGGFIASTKEVIEYLRFYSRSYLFSTGIPPSVAGSIIKALEIIRADKSIRERLLYNINYFKTRLLDMKLKIGDPKAAIIPIFIPDIQLLLRVSARLFNKGIFHNVMAYPAVPMGGSLLRFGIMATHTKDELKKTLNAIQEAAEEEKLFDYYKMMNGE
ncbi:MAG: aminotransferase class I/II-fold pyridoxal phosphate-dependent enzyme [Spirochaetes bacterium]|nr:aminotransferase class I/II-fold pyridoxal phosphate-dependent enzyme [Spirochaetota bacterium]